jgi:hypothetical protein
MHAEPYRSCQDCGASLDSTTVYQRHAYCTDCTGLSLR